MCYSFVLADFHNQIIAPCLSADLASGICLIKSKMFDPEENLLHLDVRRQFLLRDAMREARKKKFNPKKHIQVEQ